MRVGVIVPVGGFAPFLAEALDAVLAASPDRVVVVDDGARRPLALHPDHAGRVELVRRDRPGGPAAARDAGARHLGDGVDAVALCDADDAWPPDHLARAVSALAADGAGWTFSRAHVVGPDGRATGERWAAAAPGAWAARRLGPLLYARNLVPTSSVVLRRQSLEAAGGFSAPDLVAEDWDLWLRLCGQGVGAVCVDGAPIRYRRHPDGLTADVARLARAQGALHARHAGLVDGVVAAAAQRADTRALRRATLRARVPLARRDPYRR